MTDDKAGPSGLTTQPTVESIHVPRLNPPSMADTNIETYFMSLEFWFAASGIGAHPQQDSRKYNIVMAQVPPNKLTALRSIIEATPASDKYVYIKTKLIDYFADSQQRRLQQVLGDMPLGDLKPSQLFNEMKRVAGNSLSEPVLIDLWASRLPPYAQAAAIAQTGDVANKIVVADAIVDSMGLRQINSIDYHVQNSAMAAPIVPEAAVNDPIEDLRMEVARLANRLEKLLTNKKSVRGRARSRSRTVERHNSRHREPSVGTCWYHRKFGKDSRRCRSPCSYGQQGSSNQQ